MKKPSEATANTANEVTPAQQNKTPSGQRRPKNTAAPALSEDTVSTRTPAAKRGKKTPAAAPDLAPATPEVHVPVTADVTPTRGRRKQADAPTPALPRRARKASPEAAAEPAPAVMPAPETTPEPQAPLKHGRKPRAAAPVVADPLGLTPEPAPVEPTLDPAPTPEAAPAPRRGRKPKQPAVLPQEAVPAVTETAAPAQLPEPVIEQAPAAVPEAAVVKAPRSSRRKTTPTRPAVETGAEPVDITPEAASAEPVLLEVPRKRGRPRKAVTPDLPALSGVEEVSVPEASPAQAAQPVTEPTQDPVVDTPAALADAPTPAPAVREPRRKRTAARAAQPTPVTPAPVEETQPPAAEPETDTGPESASLSPAEDLLVAQLRKLGRPVHVRDLERTFTRQALDRLGGWRELGDLLENLVDAGTVIRTRKKTYGLPEAMSLVRGRFQASAAGFGFVVPDSGGDDYYIPAEQTLEAWNGDIVLVRMEGRGDSRDGRGPRRGQRGDGNPRASVVRIVQRAYSKLVGTLEFHHGHPILKPDDHRARHRILLLPEGLEGLEAGARVVTELFWPEHTGEDEVFGQVTRVLGAEDDPETETEAVIVKYGLRGEFPAEVEAQAAAIPTQIPPEALKGRLDLRSFNIFTVDGRDAKDFDDAIHIQPTPEGTFVVGVHIADVSHYVREGTPLDEEAYARATSVYLPGRVLPMLPEHLSNGVCSLVPYEDRLTLTAMVELSAEGDILDVKLTPSVINSKARLTYDEVQAYSEATSTLPDHARHLEGDLHLLLKITSKLRQKRLREGSLDFKMREVKVDVGPDGRMELIPIREETARGMIEDLMLLANKVVAHELLQREIPALFRIHEEPTLQRFQEVTQAIGRLGLAFPGGEPTPQAYQTVLKQVRGTHRESVVNTLLLRSMQQAKYAGENLGHFGLAFDEYLHFTSPIRRYPDLLVHRVLKAMLAGDLKAGSREVAQLQGRLPGMGEHTSDRERTAAEAERDLTKYYQAKWAQEHLHEHFDGNVSGVVASGLYVALDNGVEGKLHISHLDDDYYVYIEDAQMLRGRSGGRNYLLGDPVAVTISAVNPLARMIDLTLTSSQENDMNDVKPRARRREDREAERREKLQSVQPSAPRKFTLDEPQPAVPSAPARQGQGRGNGRIERGRSSQGQGGRTFGGVTMNRAQGGPRRVITLERPRNEHLRPVNITVQRMYFGDWTLDNMPPEEPQGSRGGRYDRQDRFGGDRGARSYSRGSNDRGAVRSVNGRSAASQGQNSGAPAPRAAQAQPAPVNADAQGDDAKRRRRRRGRRGNGSGTAGQD